MDFCEHCDFILVPFASEPCRTCPGNPNNNPYWKRVCDISERQRAKGMGKYGQGLESNPADMVKRIEHLEEELIDGLMYCEWIKEKLFEIEGRTDD